MGTLSLALHEQLAQRLRDILVAELPNIEVQFNRFLTLESMSGLERLDAAVSKRTALQESLEEFVGEDPVSDFIAGVLQDAIWNNDFESDPNRIKLLTKLDDWSDVNAVAEYLVAELGNLPRRYHLFAALPHFVLEMTRDAMAGEVFDLSTDLSLVSGEQLETAYPSEPEESAARAGLFPRSVGLYSHVAYIKSDSEGYIPQLGITRPVQDFNASVRSFFGLCIALRLFRGGPSPPGQTTDRPILIFESVGEGRYTFKEPHQFSTEISRGIEGIRPDLIMTRLDTIEAQQYARSTLSEVRSVFQSEPTATESVLRAAQWLFDSHCGGSQLLSFVQATVSLEILLGDHAATDRIGLGELMRNRCAYLIGTSRSQREEILKDFNRIYDTRSRIVHRGKSRLSRSELRDLVKLRWMCGRIIQEEVKLIQADSTEVE